MPNKLAVDILNDADCIRREIQRVQVANGAHVLPRDRPPGRRQPDLAAGRLPPAVGTGRRLINRRRVRSASTNRRPGGPNDLT